jgi:peptidoglycan/LPS O-acetylase OafA/YrhL
MRSLNRLLVLTLLVCFVLTAAAFAAVDSDYPAYVSDLDTGTFGFAPVMAITVICYLAAVLLKATPLDNKWLPVICGFCGAILGAIAMLIGMQGFPAADWLTAIAIGIVSGLAATGVHQIGKQLGGKE